jgi:hypothetical protein
LMWLRSSASSRRTASATDASTRATASSAAAKATVSGEMPLLRRPNLERYLVNSAPATMVGSLFWIAQAFGVASEVAPRWFTPPCNASHDLGHSVRRARSSPSKGTKPRLSTTAPVAVRTFPRPRPPTSHVRRRGTSSGPRVQSHDEANARRHPGHGAAPRLGGLYRRRRRQTPALLHGRMVGGVA